MRILIQKAGPWRNVDNKHIEEDMILNLAKNNPIDTFVRFGQASGLVPKINKIHHNLTSIDLPLVRKIRFEVNFIITFVLLLFFRPNKIICLGSVKQIPGLFYTLLNKKVNFLPIFIGEFNYANNYFAREIKTIKIRLLGNLLGKLNKRIKKVYVISSAVLSDVIKICPQLSSKIEIYHYNLPPYFKPLKNNTSSEIKQILTSCRITPRKGLHNLIKAFSLLKDKLININIIIRGPVKTDFEKFYYKKLQDLIKNEGLDDFIKLNNEYIPYEKLADNLRSADLYILPSLAESLGISILEALYCGTPVIASRVGGIPDMIDDGKNGYLCMPNDVEDLADKIAAYLENNKFSDRQFISDYTKNYYTRNKKELSNLVKEFIYS